MLCGDYIITLNAGVAIRIIRRRHAPSWIPLLGGCLLATGLAVLPFDCPLWLVLLPLLMDPGCVLGTGWMVGWHLCKARSPRDVRERTKR